MKKAREALSKLPDVSDVMVDFKAKTATIKMKTGKKLEKDSALDALKGQGYGVTAFATLADTLRKQESKG